MQQAGGSWLFNRTSVVWNGQEYGVAWTDNTDSLLHFRRFFADGTPAAPVVTPTFRQALPNYAPSLVWNGTGYGVAWVAANTSYWQLYFARLNADGSMIGGETKVSFVGLAETTNVTDPALAWSGSGYAAVWDHYVGAATNNDTFATLLNPDGTIANSGASHDLVISNAVSTQYQPAVAWSAGAGKYLIVWADFRSGVKYELWGATLTTAGAISLNGSLVSGTGSALNPQLVDAGGSLGLVWYDSRDGNQETYFARLSAAAGLLSKLGADVRLTNDPANSNTPQIAWTGAEFGVVWQDTRNGGNYETWFQRVSVDGVAQGTALQVSHTGNGQSPAAAFGRYGYLISFSANGSANQVQAWGCNTVTSPPSCPGNFNAYNITGTSASVTWSPSGDTASDIAYYQVYRNNVAVGKTSGAYFNDGIAPLPPLPLSSTNNYMIQPVNAAQFQNFGCTSSIYVRTNASLTLTMNKSTPDAVLNWTNAGFNNYNIFRSNDPRVMSQIGATPSLTAPDPNALNNSLSYFYSVDNPGP